jgi:hypothetical protein
LMTPCCWRSTFQAEVRTRSEVQKGRSTKIIRRLALRAGSEARRKATGSPAGCRCRDYERHDQRADEQRHVDAVVVVAERDAVRRLPEVHRVEVVARRVSGGEAAAGPPRSRIRPRPRRIGETFHVSPPEGRFPARDGGRERLKTAPRLAPRRRLGASGFARRSSASETSTKSQGSSSAGLSSCLG